MLPNYKNIILRYTLIFVPSQHVDVLKLNCDLCWVSKDQVRWRQFGVFRPSLGVTTSLECTFNGVNIHLYFPKAKVRFSNSNCLFCSSIPITKLIDMDIQFKII